LIAHKIYSAVVAGRRVRLKKNPDTFKILVYNPMSERPVSHACTYSLSKIGGFRGLQLEKNSGAQRDHPRPYAARIGLCAGGNHIPAPVA
jgi:hypothetical protein